MKSAEVRSTFLEYFRGKGHAILPSSPVIPQGDPTLLFTNAGMVQFKDIFTGRAEPKHPRAATVQKCIRAGGKHNDLDNVGYTARHLTFFEMLGNFSFGDYFKKEAIEYAWELVTQGFQLDPARLWVTVFREDDEAFRLWKEIAGLPDSRIVRLGEEDNFWSMGEVGPCGPCSEILYDRGPAYGPEDVENGERIFEIWNLVFMQYDQKPDGSRVPLPKPSIDTGMGLERMVMVLQGVESVFETDILGALVKRVEELSGVAYDPGPGGVPHRVLADHLRSLAFAIADGEIPSNEGRGYVLRRILRRAARYGRKLGVEEPILCRMVGVLVAEMGEAYPELREAQSAIERILRNEEETFGRTLDRGIERFEEIAREVRARGGDTIPGEEVFVLYDRYGFPVDLVERMAEEAGLRADTEGFERLMERKQEESRETGTFYVVSRDESLENLPPTRFAGYETTRGESEILFAAPEGGRCRVVLAETPFYAESGGQVGDTGYIEGEGFRLRVLDTQKDPSGRFVHIAAIEEGEPALLRKGTAVRAVVDEERRRAIERNHSATHLLHAALRRVLGTHVRQKGSLVEPRRLRFDVTHFNRIDPSELAAAEDLVTEHVLEDIEVETLEMDRDEAIRQGALAFFGEKYGDRVRVVRMGDFSMELCGGTHVRRTGEVGPFVLVAEGSVSSGVRRLEALTAQEAERLYRANAELIDRLAKTLKVPPEKLVERVEKLLEEVRELKSRRGAPPAPAVELRKRRFGDVLFAGGVLEGAGMKELLEAYDLVKKEAKEVVAGLLGREDGKVALLIAMSPSLEKRGLDARKLLAAVKDILDARGGGRPVMVQAGGKKAEGAEAALEKLEGEVERLLQGG